MTICFGTLAAIVPEILPMNIAVGICIGAVIGAVVGIGLWLYGRKLASKEQKEQEAKALTIRADNKGINAILDIVEAMDNRLYYLLPKAERRILRKPNCRSIFTLGNAIRIRIWFRPHIFRPNVQSGVERLSGFLDEKQVGLESYTTDKVYSELDSKLSQLTRLKNIGFRNAVYTFVRFSYGLNSELLFFRIIKALYNIPLFATMAIRRVENLRQQGMGNILTTLALKLEEYTENEYGKTSV